MGFRFTSDELKASEGGAGSGDRTAKSPMPGTVTKVFQKEGATVKKGESIVAMEAMKMELVIKAEFDCVIEKINVAENSFVEAGAVLVEVKPVEKK